jgi:hypothetical protein
MPLFGAGANDDGRRHRNEVGKRALTATSASHVAADDHPARRRVYAVGLLTELDCT